MYEQDCQAFHSHFVTARGVPHPQHDNVHFASGSHHSSASPLLFIAVFLSFHL